MNMVFADGHTEYYRWKDYRTTRYDNGQTALPEAGSEAGNEDFDFLVRSIYGRCCTLPEL